GECRQPCRIDLRNILQVEDDVALTLKQQAVHLVLEPALHVEDQPTLDIDANDATYLTLSNLHDVLHDVTVRPACGRERTSNNGQSDAPMPCPSLPHLP